MIPALVLTAGLATRLRPLSLVRAKAALPVAGEPLVSRIIRSLAAAGVADVVLNLHHLPHTLASIVGDGEGLGVRVRYSWETPVLGSAGGPRKALPLLASSFCILNGDTLTDVNVRALHERHLETGALVTMAVIPNAEPHKYGGIALDDDDAFLAFVPKGSTSPSFHFVGVQVAEGDAFTAVPPDTFASVADVYPALVAAKPGVVRGFRTQAEFFDIGTPADYLSTSLVLGHREDLAFAVGRGSTVASSASVEQSVIWDDVVVEAGARLHGCIVTDGTRVPAETSWHGVTLRRATDELAPGEHRDGDLAVSAL